VSDQAQPPSDQIAFEPGAVLHAHIADQPTRLFELSPVLLSKYEVENGTVTIAGCSIDDEPIFEVARFAGGAGSSEPVVQFFDQTGWQLDADTVESLGLESPANLQQLPPGIRPSHFQNCLQQGSQRISAQTSPDRIELRRVIWCKRATGKISIRIGERTAQVAFLGWTRRLINGADPLAPFVCPLSGKASYHIVADDDGRLTVPEAVTACDVSGRRVVETVLENSALSGKRALPQYMASCCVGGERILQSELVTCKVCEQAISPQAALANGCRGCQDIPKADAETVQHWTEVFPGLAKWKSIKIRETHSRVFISATKGWHRMLIVADKSNQQILCAKQALRFFGTWRKLDIDEAHKLF